MVFIVLYITNSVIKQEKIYVKQEFKHMKINTLLYKKLFFRSLALLFLTNLIACAEDDSVGEMITISSDVTINMEQYIDGTVLEMNTSTQPYTNGMNQTYNVTRLQYLISDLTFHHTDGSSVTLEGYHLVDLSDSTTLTYSPGKVPNGNYSSISFTFGFDAEDNVNSTDYADLNLDWTWPDMLGGGYHFMRLEGDYTAGMSTGAFKTHMGTARDTSTTPFTFEENHIDITLANSALTVSGDFSFDLNMNIEEWYENPTLWDFTVWNAPIMPTYEAQKALNSNGASVFTITK